MNLEQLAKVKFAFTLRTPKRGSPEFHKALLDLINEDLAIANIHEIMLIYTAFRGLNNDLIHTKLMKEIAKQSETIKRSINEN